MDDEKATSTRWFVDFNGSTCPLEFSSDAYPTAPFESGLAAAFADLATNHQLGDLLGLGAAQRRSLVLCDGQVFHETTTTNDSVVTVVDAGSEADEG